MVIFMVILYGDFIWWIYMVILYEDFIWGFNDDLMVILRWFYGDFMVI